MWCGAGFEIERLWSLSLREVSAQLTGASELRRVRQIEKREEIWLNAALNRATRLPAFRKFVDAEARPRRQSRAELQANFDILNAMWGDHR